MNTLEKFFGAKHIEVAKTLNSLGIAYNGLRDYKEAAKYYNQAKLIYEKKLGPMHLHLATTLCNLGWAYHKLNEHREAVIYYDQALAIHDKLFQGNFVADTAKLFYNLGEAHKALGQYQQAIQYFEQSLAIREALFNKADVSVAATLSKIGKAYGGLNEYEEEIEYHKKALAIFKKILDKDHHYINVALMDLIKAHLNIVSQHIEVGNISLAIEYQEKANDLLSHRELKHDLACYYHISARQALQNKDHNQYNARLLQAKNTFKEGLELQSKDPVPAALYTEYAMFLFINYYKNDKTKYSEILSQLDYAKKLKDDGSEHSYSQLEKITVVEPLQKLLDREKNIIVRVCDLADYLLIKTHLMHENKTEAERVFEVFRQSIEKEETQLTSVSLWLLYSAAEELGYSDQARVLKKKYDAIKVTKTK